VVTDGKNQIQGSLIVFETAASSFQGNQILQTFSKTSLQNHCVAEILVLPINSLSQVSSEEIEPVVAIPRKNDDDVDDSEWDDENDLDEDDEEDYEDFEEDFEEEDYDDDDDEYDDDMEDDDDFEYEDLDDIDEDFDDYDSSC
jgi:hypothetical protein